MRFLLFLLFLFSSPPAYAQTTPWEYIGKANATGYDTTHTMVTRGADFGLALTWWEQTQELYLVFSYNNEDHNLPLEGSVEFLNEYIDYYYSDDVYEQKITTAIVQDLPTENQTLLMAAVNLEEVYGLQDSVGISVKFLITKNNSENYTLTSDGISRAYNDMEDAIKAETGGTMIAAYEARADVQTEAVKKARYVEVDGIISDFQLTEAKCGQFERHNFNDSETVRKDIGWHNEVWFNCLETQYLEYRSQFGKLVTDLGGSLVENDDGDFINYTAPSDIPQLRAPLKIILDSVQAYAASGQKARGEYNDYIEGYNRELLQMQQNKNARIASQNRKNENDRFWNDLSESLADSQQQIDDMNAYTSSLLSQQIYTTPGYK